jgi:tetratricopeptide (TPR) repeat protein
MHRFASKSKTFRLRVHRPVVTRELFVSSHVSVVASVIAPESPLLVVTFSNWDQTPSFASGRGWSAQVLRRSVNNIHIACAGNDWYQYPELDDLPRICADLIAKHPEVVTYGASMGGYAALAFSKVLSAKRVVAIAPQISIDRARCPWEARWPDEARRIAFIRDDMASQLSRTAEIFVLYDPLGEDRRHVDELRKIRPVHELLFPFAGHLVGQLLAELHLFRRLIPQILERGLVPPDFRSELRARRATSPSYLAALGERLRTRAPSAAQKTAVRARALLYRRGQRHNLVARRAVAWLFWRLGDRAEARRLLDVRDAKIGDRKRRAEAKQTFKSDLERLRAGDGWRLRAQSLASAARGDGDAAISLARESVEADPQNTALWQHLAGLLFGAGDFGEARAALASGLALDGQDLFFLGGLIQACARLGDFEAGAAYAIAALRLDASNVWTRTYAAELLRACGRGDLDAAVGEAERLARLGDKPGARRRLLTLVEGAAPAQRLAQALIEGEWAKIEAGV